MITFFRNVRVLVSFTFIFYFRSALASDPAPLLKFIENKNQWLSHVQFAAHIPGGSMTIGSGKFSYYFLDTKKLQELHEHSHEGMADGALDNTIRGHSVQVIFQNANLNSVPLPFGRSSEYYNYYIGSDPQRWASKAFAYEGMLYPSLYEGIDLKIYSSGKNLKYDFIVAPYADPSRISVKYEGADDIVLENGNLVLKTSLAELIEKRPVAFQYIDGKKVFVECRYELRNNVLTFGFPEGYDPCAALIIDPLLIFSTFSGSTADNWGSTATPGEHGNLYSAGVTSQIGGEFYPTTPGVFQTTSGGIYDIGVLKYDSTGSTLLYSTYLGGSQSESAHSLVMNANEELIVLGTTSSADFPTTGSAFDRTFVGGTSVTHVINYANGSDLFIARLAKDGTQLIASTFLGGSDNDGLNPNRDPDNTNLGFPLTKNYGDELRGDIITDDSGNVYLTSVTLSHDFPVANGFGSTFRGGATDGVVIKLNADLSAVLWSSYLGGSGVDAAHTIKLDSEGNIFVAGGTNSIDFPTTTGSYQKEIAGDADGWIAKISADGSTILNCTFTGTSRFDQVYFLDLNKNDEPFVYGQTSSSKFPVTPGVYNNPRSGQFIQKFNNTLTLIHFSTVFGSGRGNSETTTPDISPTAFLVNDCNNIYVTGWGGGGQILNGRVLGWLNTTIGLPVTSDAFQRVSSGHDFYFMVLADDASKFLYGTYFGGARSLTHVDGGTCRFDKNGIVYHAVCSGCNTDGLGPKSDFPTTPGAWSTTNQSGRNCNNAAFKFDLSSLRAIIQTNTEDLSSPGINVVCIPDAFVLQNFSIGGEIFEWDLGDGTQITKIDNANFSHAYKEPGQYLVKLKAIDQGTCLGVDSTATLVTVYKAESEVQEDDALCEGDPYMLKATGGMTYHWTSEHGGFSSSSAQPVVSPADTTKYYVTLTEANGCVRKDSVQLNVVPAMVPDFQFYRASACDDRAAVRVTNLTDSVKANDNIFLEWGDGNTSDQPEALHQYEKDGVYHVRMIATREFCVYEKAVDIPVFKITLPNIITPGAPEGKNDTFTIQFGEVEGVTPGDYGFKVDLTVYNRWGTILLQKKDYQYDWSGEGLTTGIYYFEVSIQDHASCKSWLHLIK